MQENKSSKLATRVALTSNLFFPFIGGVENSLFYLSKAFSKEGYRTVILTSDISKFKDDVLEAEQKIQGIDIQRYSFSNKKVLVGPLLNIWRCLLFYRNQVQAYGNTLYVCRYHFNQMMLRLAGAKQTIYLVPGVIKYQNDPKYNPESSFKDRLKWYYHRVIQKIALRCAGNIVVFSNNMKEQIEKLGVKKKISISKPGVDVDRFTQVSLSQKLDERKKLGLTSEKNRTVFLCVGRCVGVKGFEIAVRTFAQTPEKFELWIVGDGEDKAKLEQMAQTLNVANRVKFWGASKETEVFYRCADYFILPSLYEPLGQTLLEALASGLPIVSFEPSLKYNVNTATRDLMSDEHCHFVPEPSAECLSETLRNLPSPTSSEYSEAAMRNRKYAEESFTWNKLAQDLLDISQGKLVQR